MIEQGGDGVAVIRICASNEPTLGWVSRFVDHRDMTAADIMACSREALAIIQLCEAAAWAIQNGGGNTLGLANAITIAPAGPVASFPYRVAEKSRSLNMQSFNRSELIST